MKKLFKNPAFYFFCFNLFLFPLLLMTILFGISGSNPLPYIGISIAYLMAFVSSVIGFKHKKLLFLNVGCYLVIVAMFYLDSTFWHNHNKELCQQIKNDRNCVEKETYFYCDEKSSLGSFSTGKGICSN